MCNNLFLTSVAPSADCVVLDETDIYSNVTIYVVQFIEKKNVVLFQKLCYCQIVRRLQTVRNIQRVGVLCL